MYSLRFSMIQTKFRRSRRFAMERVWFYKAEYIKNLVSIQEIFYTWCMKCSMLCAWLGQRDIDAAAAPANETGPIAMALDTGKFRRLTLLSNYPSEETDRYVVWLGDRYPDLEVGLYPVALTTPTAYEEIYTAADRVLRETADADTALTFHLSPGTPAMASVWIILANGRYGANLVETHRNTGFKEVRLPFDILARYRPERGLETHISALEDELLPESPAFDRIIHRSDTMRRAVAKAKRAAVFDVPVLLLGESGTGKELFAKAIHAASERSSGPFVPVNCGAIPPTLAESALFGHAKGAFTGATTAQPGYLEQAHGGTLFLDEIGDLGLDLQVKLLRVLNDRRVRRVGDEHERTVDFRLISATNRYLAGDVAEERFRQDLFHRIAVGVIKLPPLRQRGEDLLHLTEFLVRNLNDEFAKTPGWKEKSLNVGAMRVITEHPWPGNVRELINTLTRAFVFNGGTEIDETAVRDALLPLGPPQDGVLHKPLVEGFSIETVIRETAAHYLERAMEQAGGNKTRAAALLGLGSYQTLSNWLERYGVD